MSPGNSVAAPQTLGLLREQDHQLLTTRAYRLDEPSAKGKLLYEGRRDPREGRGDEDRLVRSVLGEPLCPIAHHDLDVRDAVTG